MELILQKILVTNSSMDFEPDTSSLIGKVFSCCEIFEPESKKEEKYNKKWLTNSVEEIFSEMQKYFYSKLKLF